MGEVDIEEVFLSNKISICEKNYKNFIGYVYNGNKVKQLNTMLPKISAYVKSYDGQTKWIYILIEDDDLLEKVSADIKNEVDSEPVCSKNFLKTKIKSHSDELTDFYDKNILSLLDSSLKKDDNYYPQSFLKECKFVEKKLVRHIHDSLRDFSYLSDESDEE